jgi:glycine oxidase
VPEIIVIGAGIIGCSCAYELARRGARVTLLDARPAGRGATQASAGVLAPFIEAPADTALQRLCVSGLELYDDFVTAVARDAQVDVEYHRNGTIEVALDQDEAEALERTADVLRGMRVPHELLHGSAIHAADSAISPAAEAALVVPGHGFVSAPGLTAALVRAGAAHGVQLREGVRVTRIAPRGTTAIADRSDEATRPGAGSIVVGTGAGVRIETSEGPIEADAVLLAAGSWSGVIDIDGVPPAPIRPIRGQLLHLAWKTAPLTRVVWGSRCYMVPWDSGRVLVGATVEEVGFVEEVTVAGIQALLTAAIELVPRTAAAGFLEARVGLRPASADTLPIIGPSPDLPGLFYATGHYRNGILLAPLTAAIIADIVISGRAHPLLELAAPGRTPHAVSASQH